MQISGRLHAGDKEIGVAFPLTSRTVATAMHVYSLGEGRQLSYLPHNSPSVPVVEAHTDANMDVAVLCLASDVPAPGRFARGRRHMPWRADGWRRSNEGVLSGEVTDVDLAIELQKATEATEVMQLHVKEGHRSFKGRSGSAVRNDDDAIIGMLVEQVPRRATRANPGEPDALNILWAIPVKAILDRFESAIQSTRTADAALAFIHSVPVQPARESTGTWEPIAQLSHGPGLMLTHISFNPDGNSVVSAATSGDLRVWDATEDKQVAERVPHDGEAHLIRFGGDGRRMVAASRHAGGSWSVSVWDCSRFSQPPWSKDSDVPFSDVHLAPDSRWLAVAGWGLDSQRQGRLSPVAGIWDVENDRRILTFQGDPVDEYTSRVEFSPDGQWFAASSFKSGTRLWRVDESGRLGREVLIRPRRLENDRGTSRSSDFSAELLEFSPSGRWLFASFTERGPIWAFDLRAAARPPVGPLGPSDGVWSFAASADDELVAIGHSNGVISVWTIEDGVAQATVTLDGSRPVRELAVGPAEQFIVARMTMHPGVHLWDLVEGGGLRSLHDDADVGRIAVGRNGTIATASADTAVLWSRPSSATRPLG